MFLLRKASKAETFLSEPRERRRVGKRLKRKGALLGLADWSDLAICRRWVSCGGDGRSVGLGIRRPTPHFRSKSNCAQRAIADNRPSAHEFEPASCADTDPFRCQRDVDSGPNAFLISSYLGNQRSEARRARFRCCPR